MSRAISIGVLLAFGFASLLAAAPPALEWTDLDGESFEVQTLRGRVVVLNFWATWCKPCVEEMPDLEGIHDRLGGQGVEVLGASADAPEKADAVRRFAKRHDISFPLVLGATTDQMEILGLPPTLPGTVILDREGNVARRYPGVIDREALEKAVHEVLEGRQAAEPEPEPEAAAAAEEEGEADGHAHAHDDGHDHKPSSKASLVPS